MILLSVCVQHINDMSGTLLVDDVLTLAEAIYLQLRYLRAVLSLEQGLMILLSVFMCVFSTSMICLAHC